MSKKILFISHDSSRTGAPIVFLNLLKWFKTNTNIPFTILLKKRGVLEKEFKSLAPVLMFPENQQNSIYLKNRIRGEFEKILGIRNLKLQNLKRKLKKENIALIYANTAVNGEILELLSALNCPIICHIHELKWTIESYVGLESFQSVINNTHFYIAVSEAVKYNLMKSYQIPEHKIEKIYAFIPTDTSEKINQEHQRKSIAKQLKIPIDAKIICASGTTDWRKGADLFIQLARLILNKYTDCPVYFIWVGGQKKGFFWSQLLYDIENLDLKKYVHFVGTKPNPLDYFSISDVFTLLSREDPFPLVCLEAASLAKPIVCFDQAGGMKEFVESDCGFVVPYLDLETMATKVVDLLKSPQLSQILGETAKIKVRQRHDIGVVTPQILNIINRFIN